MLNRVPGKTGWGEPARCMVRFKTAGAIDFNQHSTLLRIEQVATLLRNFEESNYPHMRSNGLGTNGNFF
jgi:hypothetical protein